MASVYRIRKEVLPSGMRYVVDYRDSAGRRTKRRFKKARDAEAFKKQVEASTYTGLPIPRPVHMDFADWAEGWISWLRGFGYGLGTPWAQSKQTPLGHHVQPTSRNYNPTSSLHLNEHDLTTRD